MTILQIILFFFLVIDVSVSWYAISRNIHLNDSYYKFQKSYGLKSFSIIKIIAVMLYIYILPRPTVSQYGSIITVPCYGFFVILLCYHFFLSLKVKQEKKNQTGIDPD